ncbi:MAG TPA: PstS family phosphate ABC transporter substrate-binding protein [Pseudomonadales bacterium]|nr:PstS family phosphate ABC transporter substrate-binding protein [Pseudomonadales bacterium]
MKKLLSTAIAVAALTQVPVALAQRDNISIVGSSTVYPFSTVVAERFGRAGTFKTPKVEATGTGGGIKLFCSGVGVQHPDIANASRRMKDSEFADCAKNGVTGITEVVIGFDGIVIANARSAHHYELTLKDMFLALAKDVPNPDGSETLVPNPYKTWKDVNPALPANRIEVLGPPPTSGTRDAFVELAMEGGCKSFPWVKAIKDQDENRFKAVCHAVREDGAYIEAGENDNLIVQKLGANPNSLGIFGYSFMEENADKVQGSKVAGVEPTYESIADGSYAVSRPLYFYVKTAHADLIPGIREFVAEFVSERAMGEDGYLADRGLIALPQDQYEATAAAARSLAPFAL